MLSGASITAAARAAADSLLRGEVRRGRRAGQKESAYRA